jgi:hypothetical protein
LSCLSDLSDRSAEPESEIRARRSTRTIFPRKSLAEKSLCPHFFLATAAGLAYYPRGIGNCLVEGFGFFRDTLRGGAGFDGRLPLFCLTQQIIGSL